MKCKINQRFVFLYIIISRLIIIKKKNNSTFIHNEYTFFLDLHIIENVNQFILEIFNFFNNPCF